MQSFSHIDNTDDFGRIICTKEKEIDINIAYNQNNLSIDITRLAQVPIFIDKEPLENWIKPVIKSENNPSKSSPSQEQTHFSFDTVLKEKKPELDPEKQQQYAVFLSRFANQSIFKDYLIYLNACGFIPTKLKLSIHIALYSEAIYIQINCEGHPLKLKPDNENGKLSDIDDEKPRNISKSEKKDFESTITYKIVLTEVPIDKQNLIQDTSQKNTNYVKIERILLESKLTCLKKYEAKFNPHIEEPFNPPVIENSKLPSALDFLLNKIISLLNFIKAIFKKDHREEPGLKEHTTASMDIHSSNLHQKEEKVKLDTLYFDPNCNKLARNLEDFPIRCVSETTESNKSDSLPLKEEVLVTTPTLRHNNDINKEKPYLTKEDRSILPANTHQTEKKVKRVTFFSNKVARKSIIDSKSINPRHMEESNKPLKNPQSQLIFFKKEKKSISQFERRRYKKKKAYFTLSKVRS